MNIIAKKDWFDFREYDSRFRHHLASRQHELNGLAGLRRLIARFKLELWAWKKAVEDLKQSGGGIE